MAEPPSDLVAIIADYQATREDDRTFIVVQTTVMTLALGALTLLGTLAKQQQQQEKGQEPFPDAVLAGAPLLVITMLAFLQANGAASVLRSFYLRAMEREIRSRLTLTHNLGGYSGLPALAYGELITCQQTLARGRTFFRVMTYMVFGCLWGIFGGIVVLFIAEVSLPWKLIMIPLYGGGSLLLFAEATRTNRQGRHFFQQHVVLLRTRLQQPLTPRHQPVSADGRSLAGYLLLPRPDDLVKIVFPLLAFVLAWAHSTQGSDVGTLQMFAYVLVFELVAYQARYQWNDLRGTTEDRDAPSAHSRGRLPGGRASSRISMAVIALRIYTLGWFTAIAWPDNGGAWSEADTVLIAATFASFLLAWPYEALRQRLRRRRRCSESELMLLLALVGLGYCLRFSFGWLLFDLAKVPTYNWLIMLCCWGLGILFVSMTWLLECSSYITGTAADEGGDPQYCASPTLAVKPHLLELYQLATGTTLTLTHHPFSAVNGRELRMFALHRWRRWNPWWIGLCIAWVGLLLVSLEVTSAGSTPAWAPIAGVGCLLAAAAAKHRRTELMAVQAASVALPLLVATGLDSPTDLDLRRLILLGLLSLLPGAIYLSLASQSYGATRSMGTRAAAAAKRFVAESEQWVLGDPQEAEGLTSADR